jgi:hypothetical protein
VRLQVLSGAPSLPAALLIATDAPPPKHSTSCLDYDSARLRRDIFLLCLIPKICATCVRAAGVQEGMVPGGIASSQPHSRARCGV